MANLMLLLFERQQLKSCKIFITNKDGVIQREKKKKNNFSSSKIIET